MNLIPWALKRKQMSMPALKPLCITIEEHQRKIVQINQRFHKEYEEMRAQIEERYEERIKKEKEAVADFLTHAGRVLLWRDEKAFPDTWQVCYRFSPERFLDGFWGSFDAMDFLCEQIADGLKHKIREALRARVCQRPDLRK